MVAEEAADLVEPGGVPGLGDQLGAGQNRVSLDVPEDRGAGEGPALVIAREHGGQIVVSETTRRLLAADAPVRDLGEHRLKDLIGAERLFQLGEGDFPPLRTLDATTLPVVSIPLVGRERELEELVELLSNGTRLVTVTPDFLRQNNITILRGRGIEQRDEDDYARIAVLGTSAADVLFPAVAQS